MYLLDSSCADRMERGTPQRKTVYRISLTLVKRESLDGVEGEEAAGGGSGPQRAESSKVGSFRRESSTEIQRSYLLEQLKEVENESDDSSSSHRYMRNFRTFSTGQLELGRLKICKKHKLQKDLKETATSPLTEHSRDAPSAQSEEEKPEERSRMQEKEDSDTLKDGVSAEASRAASTGVMENGSVEKKTRLLKAQSAEERSCEPPLNGDEKISHSTRNGKVSPETPPLKRQPSLLRRSFSFRHWTGGELLRLRALSKDKHHSSSGCISGDAGADGGEANAKISSATRSPAGSYAEPPREKSRTLEMGAVLNKTDSMGELSRWERAHRGKNRTLDNSDLLRLAAEKDSPTAGGFLLRGGGGRSSERRLVRFFSGFFSRRDGATTSTPLGSPSANRSLRRTRKFLSQSSTESMNGGSNDDAFVNSQEWTLSRMVPELKVGIVGNLASGKSALVHRYLTGTYVQEESPEGGRFKKEIVVDGQSHLLLIRDEGGPPEAQFALWVDAVIFVFSLEDEISFQTVYHYFSRLANYRNTADLPLVLVGTQDAISSANPRVIDDSRARKLSNDLKRCTYYETCATYGLNVERVFQD
ncbi:uncharacterized protein LOC143002368, partial [Genypterus blacodes]|uniref:uncharacterized protein LOC143002368 n=1 Tax=Genypterus blacodes TaxID=154954 RepID=UPI003F761EC5